MIFIRKIKYNVYILDIFIEKIERDNHFWSDKMENQLINFYKNDLLAEIVQPKIIT